MKKIFLLIIALASISAVNAREPKDKDGKKGKTKKIEVVSDIVDAHEMYIYGVAFSPIDSVAYITDIQKIDDAQIHLRTKFIVSRNEYSNQLKKQMLLEGEKNFSCCVVYGQKLKKLEKKYQKLQKFYQKHGFKVNNIRSDRFVFKAVRTAYTEGGYATEEIEVPVEK